MKFIHIHQILLRRNIDLYIFLIILLFKLILKETHMKNKQVIGFILALLSGLVFGQECIFYYPETEGAELVYQHFDNKDKITGKTSQKVTVYRQTANGAEAEIAVKSFDDKGELIADYLLEVRCEAGIFYFDISGYINQEMIKAYENMEMKVSTENLEMPSNLKEGQILKDGKITMDISNSGMKLMTMEVDISDRKVVGKENVTPPAGRFECYKITQTTTTKMGMKMVVKSTEWLSPGTGMIKSESYSGSDKYMGKSELVEINR